MANGLYDAGRNGFARGDIHWKAGGDTIKAILIDAASYTVNLATHANLSDIPGGAIVGAPVAVVPADPVAGVCDAPDIAFIGLSGAPSIEALVLYKDTGVAGTSTLIAYIDSATGLPTGTGAAEVDVAWSNAANKIFKL